MIEKGKTINVKCLLKPSKYQATTTIFCVDTVQIYY